MGFILYYVRHPNGWGQDKHGRWVEDARQWETWTRRAEAMRAVAVYAHEGATLGIV